MRTDLEEAIDKAMIRYLEALIAHLRRQADERDAMHRYLSGLHRPRATDTMGTH